MTRDTNHLIALVSRRSRERAALNAATSPNEVELRNVWVRQCEREINGEERFLGMPETDYSAPEMSIDDIMAGLVA